MEVSSQVSELEQIKDWKMEVDTARESIRSMRGQLEQIAVNVSKRDEADLAQVEHFQNQFIRQMEVADEMFHDLKQCAKKISNNGQVPIAHDDRPVEDCSTMNERMQTFRKLLTDLQEEFDDFNTFS
jgi:hypothetical protein